MESFAYEIIALHRDLIRYCSDRLEAMGISRGLLFPVLYVGKHRGCTPAQLAAALKLDAGHTNRSLKKLEENGFLIQKAHPEDRRAHILELTEKGETVVRESRQMFLDWEEKTMKNLNTQEQQTILEILRKLPVRRFGSGCGLEEP